LAALVLIFDRSRSTVRSDHDQHGPDRNDRALLDEDPSDLSGCG
jgi:hypothetical protein